MGGLQASWVKRADQLIETVSIDTTPMSLSPTIRRRPSTLEMQFLGSRNPAVHVCGGVPVSEQALGEVEEAAKSVVVDERDGVDYRLTVFGCAVRNCISFRDGRRLDELNLVGPI